MVVGWVGQPARLITGRPAFERQSGPSSPPGRSRSNCSPVQSVGLGGAAGMPPKAEQLPTATR